jgi:DNA-binding CsgD family transcriptional regulator
MGGTVLDKPCGFIIFRSGAKDWKKQTFFDYETKNILFPPAPEGNDSPLEISSLCSKWKEILDQKHDEIKGSADAGVQPQIYIDILQSWRRKYTVRGIVLSEQIPISKAKEKSYLFILERFKPESFNFTEIFRHWNLNHREQEIVRLILKDCYNKEIAKHLGISINTVKAYMKLLMRKLGIHTRAGILSILLTRNHQK